MPQAAKAPVDSIERQREIAGYSVNHTLVETGAKFVLDPKTVAQYRENVGMGSKGNKRK